MIQQFFKDINWKPLFASTIIALMVFVIANIAIDILKSEVFVNVLDDKMITVLSASDLQKEYDSFTSSFYWIPVVCLAVIFSQSYSCRFLMKKTTGYEYTNAIAHALFTAVLVYHFHPVYSSVGFIASLTTAHKLKPKRKGRTVNIDEYR